MALGLSTTALAADMNLTINAPDELPEVGKTFTVTVDVSGNPGFASTQFTLAFNDDIVECIGAEAGTVMDGMMSVTNPEADTGAIVVGASARDKTKDGTLATYEFEVVKNGSVEFELIDLAFNDETGEDIAIKVSAVTVEGLEDSEKEVTKPKKEKEKKPVKEEPEVPAEPEETGFTDTAGHPSEAYIEEAVERGYFQGYADGSFKPNGSVTRGAFVTVLWRMAGRPEPTSTAPFTDIGHVSAEFQKAITWAYEKGYISGRTATTFAPGDPMSRQATMKIIFFHAGGVSGAEQMFTSVYDQHYKDSASLPEWARAPMYWGIYHDLISGKTEDTLGAATNADRALLAEILVKYTDKFGA